MEKTRIILADDQLLVREGMRALLDTLPQYEVIAECADGRTALEALRRWQPEVAILDIHMPEVSGIEATRQIHASLPAIEILILSAIDRKETIQQALDAGASGYLHKDFVLDELRCALDTVLAGKRYLSPQIKDRLNTAPESSVADCLTSRQIEILRLVASGQTTKQAARTLGISPKTVEFHRAQIMGRIGVNDVTALTRYAMQQGLIS